MGKNKLLMDFGGRRLFEYAVEAAKSCDFSEIIVVTSYGEIAEYCRNLSVIRNDCAEEGISASIRLGAENVKNADGIMFITADQPFICPSVIERLIDSFKAEDKITVPVCGGVYKNPVIFPLRYRDELMGLKGDVGGKKVYLSHKDDISEVLFYDDRQFSDIDTENDIKRFRPHFINLKKTIDK